MYSMQEILYKFCERLLKGRNAWFAGVLYEMVIIYRILDLLFRLTIMNLINQCDE